MTTSLDLTKKICDELDSCVSAFKRETTNLARCPDDEGTLNTLCDISEDIVSMLDEFLAVMESQFEEENDDCKNLPPPPKLTREGSVPAPLCTYVYTKGKSAGGICHSKAIGSTQYCKKHAGNSTTK